MVDRIKNGLGDEEVIVSRNLHGSNTLAQKKSKSFFKSFLGNFGDPMLKVLLIALGIQVVFVFNSGQWIETFGIAMTIMVAVTISTVSEYGSASAFKKLTEQAASIKCRVRRKGVVLECFVSELVVGDVVLLQSGERVPADGVLVDGDVEVDQSLLNGESKEAKKVAGAISSSDFSSHATPHNAEPRSRLCSVKHACKNSELEIADAEHLSSLGKKGVGASSLTGGGCTGVDYLDKSSLFSGTVVMSGQGTMLVTKVGASTEYGKIAAELQEEVPTSPLRVKLEGLAKLISVVGYIGAALVAVAYFFNLLLVQNGFDMAAAGANMRDFSFMFEHVLRAATLVVAVIVMAVPEGLPMMITVVLSSNMKHMLRDNVLVRKLNGIETAGSMNIFFTDKTGTLTNGKLEVVGVVTGDGDFQTVNKFNNKSEIAGLLGTALRYNTQSNISGKNVIGGNSTDRILTKFSLGLRAQERLSIKSQTPFNSTDKFMSTTLSDGRVLLKGAQEVLLPRLSKIFKANGEITTLTATYKKKVLRQIDELSNTAHRIIAVAIDDVLVGLLAIRDQVRKESAGAVKSLRSAGIQTVMITGDAKATATAIAKEVGIYDGNGVVLTSDELRAMSDDGIAKILPDLRVVARALPSDKSRLVRVAQSLNLVVGMTGDGVNDAPALKKADIGFAMGSGTEVAKEAGDIVILDDNIASITKGVSYGRTIFKSIRKFLIFKLTINFCAIAISIIAPLVNVDTPITVLQMLWINLVMDTLAGLAFGGERPKEQYMTEPPKRRDEKIINQYMWTQILLTGAFTAILSLLFLTSPIMRELYTNRGPAYARSAFFAFFMMINIFNAFNARSHDYNIFSNLSTNKPFIFIMGTVLAIQLTMVYIGGSLFRTVPIDFGHLAIIMLISLSVFPMDLIRKAVVKRRTSMTT